MLLSLKKHATQLLPLLQRGFFFFFYPEASRWQEAHPPCGSQSSELEVSERSRVVYFQGQSPRGGEGGCMGQEAGVGGLTDVPSEPQPRWVPQLPLEP